MHKKKSRVWLIAIPLVILISYLLYDSFTQKSIKSLKGDFEEVAFVRNEQNKGGIIRIYAVTVGNPKYADYETCATFFPTNDYGSKTTIYFFDKNKPYPTELSLEYPHYDTNAYEAISIIKKTGSQK